MTISIAPVARQQFFYNGSPLVGGLLFTYAAGTVNKLGSYADSGGTPNTNPIVLDAQGWCDIWLPAGTRYKFTLAPANDTDPPTNAIWTRDNLVSADVTINEAPQSFAASASPWTLVGTVNSVTKIFIDGLLYRLNNFTIVGNVVTPNFSLTGKTLVDIYTV